MKECIFNFVNVIVSVFEIKQVFFSIIVSFHDISCNYDFVIFKLNKHEQSLRFKTCRYYHTL